MFVYKFFYKFLGIKFGKDFSLKGFPIIFASEGASIICGDSVHINSSFFSNLIGLYQRTVIVARTKGARINIGNNVGLSGVTLYARKGITIGDNCRIGANTKILDNDFHPVNPKKRLESSNTNMDVRPIVIGNNVFIGCNSIVLKGAEIGANTTIGAGSVVCGIIPANCVAAGNPAKVIKYFE